jgi:hypothetical protein
VNEDRGKIASLRAPPISYHELVVLELTYQRSREESVVKYYRDLKSIEVASLEFRGGD